VASSCKIPASSRFKVIPTFLRWSIKLLHLLRRRQRDYDRSSFSNARFKRNNLRKEKMGHRGTGGQGAERQSNASPFDSNVLT
jgi:hypothetical protein